MRMVDPKPLGSNEVQDLGLRLTLCMNCFKRSVCRPRVLL